MTDAQDQTKIEFFHTHVSPLAIERVTGVLKSGWLNEGAVTKEFEEKLAQTLGVSNPVTVNSGTSALQFLDCDWTMLNAVLAKH